MAEKKAEKKGEMTVGEAGHKGGEKTAETHGKEFYHEIGEKGGHKGGEKTAETHGHEFYSKIGHKGGEKVRELIKKGEEEEEKK
jgi:general stress protein YciG